MFYILNKNALFVCNIKHMKEKKPRIYPRVQQRLTLMGEQIKLARLRRHLTASLVAERAGVSRTTVYKAEKGSPSVSIGAIAAILSSLGGIDEDLTLIARDDPVGRTYQDLNMQTPKKGRR